MRIYIVIIGLLSIACIGISETHSATYYVDSGNGSDSVDGLGTSTPWATIDKVNSESFNPGDVILFKRGEVWREQLVPHSGDASGYVTYGAYGEGPKPLLLGSITRNNMEDWTDEGGNLWSTSGISVDVGNIIFNNEEFVGEKVRNENELDEQGKFWYDGASSVLKIYSTLNPADYYSNIECALGEHIAKIYFRSYIIIENLDFRYGGGHGIQTSGAHHIIIRDSDFSYIGGSRISNSARYGNAIEFWNISYDTLVEGCRLWEIYDAALTTQGSGVNQKYNQFFSNNVVWNSEYCFEYWNQPDTSVAYNIHFDSNTCVNAGHGWGHSQRWAETDSGWVNGRTLSFWVNTADTNGIYVTNNIFYEGKNTLWFLMEPWDGKDSIVSHNNLWYKPSGSIIEFCRNNDDCDVYEMGQLGEFQAEQAKGGNSIAADPDFIYLNQNDFRPATGSPACNMSDTGGHVGALPCIQRSSSPSKPGLISPSNNEADLETSVAFKWFESSDPDGDDLTYELLVCENQEFTAGCILQNNIVASKHKSLYLASAGIPFFVIGSVLTLCMPGRKKRFTGIIICLMVASTLISCGSGSSSGVASSSGNEIEYTVSGLSSGVSYHWKVVADDGLGGTSESEERTFTTR